VLTEAEGVRVAGDGPHEVKLPLAELLPVAGAAAGDLGGHDGVGLEVEDEEVAGAAGAAARGDVGVDGPDHPRHVHHVPGHARVHQVLRQLHVDGAGDAAGVEDVRLRLLDLHPLPVHRHGRVPDGLELHGPAPARGRAPRRRLELALLEAAGHRLPALAALE